MKKSLYFVVGIMICITVCAKDLDKAAIRLFIDSEKSKRVDIFDVMEDIKVVKLKSNNDFLISEIRDIVFFDNHMYILDGKSNEIFIYTDEGDTKSKINDKGPGPNEYNKVSCFYIDNNNELVLVDNSLKKKISYNLKGEYIKNSKIPFAIKSFLCLSDNRKFIIRDRIDASNKNGFLINILNNESVVKQYFPFYYENGATVWEKDHPAVIAGKKVYYNSLNNDTIYEYSSDNLDIKYTVDFCDKGIPEKIKQLPMEVRGDKIYKYLLEKKYKVSCWLSVLDDNSRSLLLTYAYDLNTYYCIYNFSGETMNQFNGPFFNDISIFEISNIQFYNKKHFCYVLDYHKISQINKSRLKTLEKRYPAIYEALMSFDIDDNPMLLFGKIRNDVFL